MFGSQLGLDGHVLYHIPRCPYCIKVRLGLWWLGLEVPLRDIRAEPAHRAALIAGGGKKTVPCLRIEGADGAVRWMYESEDILAYFRAWVAAEGGPPEPA